MRFFIRLSVIALVFIGYNVSASGQEIPFNSTWESPNGSILYIETVDPSTQEISGYYINTAAEFVPGFGCKDTHFDIYGIIYGYFIIWNVAWYNQYEDCKSLTTWSGYYDPKEQKLFTVWNTIYNSIDGPEIRPTEGNYTRIK